MLKTVIRTSIFSCLLLAFPSLADDIATVTLENGAKVVLKDDFTWEYVLIEQAPAVVAAPAVKPTATATVAAPTVKSTSDVVPPQPVKVMTSSKLIQAGLLSSAAKDGVKVSYKKAQWRGDELGLDFELTSKNSEGVVIVEAEVTFYGDNGREMETQIIKPWIASYRVADTYLRKGQTRNSRTIWLEGIDKSRWTKEMLSIRVIEVETR